MINKKTSQIKRFLTFQILSVLFQFCSNGIIHSQTQDIKFEHITTEDGLSSNVVYHILQDRKGFMWFATNDGLCRYDGYSIKEYKYSPLDSNCISSSWCSELYEDRSGNIWIGIVYSGLNRFDPTTERFTHFMHDPDNPNKINAYVVFGICEDSSGALWLGTWNGLDKLVIKKDPKTSKEKFEFTHYQHNPKDSNSLSDNRIWHLYLDKSNILWISTHERGLDKFDINNEKFTHYKYDPANPNSISFDRVRYVYEDPLGNGEILWIGTLGGLNKFDKKTEKLIRYVPDPNNKNSLCDNDVVAIYRDKGNLWIGTRGGLNIFNATNEIFRHYKHDPSNVNSISNNFIYSICKDRSRVLWFGTINGGVNKLSNERKKFSAYEGVSKNAKFKELRGMFSIHEDKEGMLWFGTEYGLYRFDRINEKITHYKHDPKNKNSLSYNQVYSIYEDFHYVDKTLWIACYGGGLDRLKIVEDEKSGNEIIHFEHFTHDPSDSNSISSNLVYKIFEDNSGKLWIATFKGLNYFDRKNEIFTRYEHDPNNPSSLSHYRVNVIYQSPHDSSNILWIGTADGLNKFYTDKNVFERFTHDPGDSNSLAHNFIYSICASSQDENNVLWIGTFGGGLNKFDVEKKKFDHFTEKDGLNNNTICSIVEDDNGYLWLSTIKGISRFDPQSKTFKNYSGNDGIIEGIHYSGSYFKSNSGEIFFSGGRGYWQLSLQHVS